MEVLATIGAISNTVQLVSFSSQIISKTIEIGRAADGALVGNTAIQSVADHLVLLKDEVEQSANSTEDIALQKLCKDVTDTACDLLVALQKLKADGGKWRNMRKALRSVWSKDKIRDLEHRLASFREEMNLHIVVKTRCQLDKIESSIQSYVSNCDGRTKDVIDAIVNQSDIFDTALEVHIAKVRQLYENGKAHAEEQHTVSRLGITQAVSDAVITNQTEHRSTREVISHQALRSAEQHEHVLDKTQELIKSSEVELIGTINVASQEEHENTRSQIAELKEALRILSEQLKSRDTELKELLKAYNNTRSTKKRRELGERSNAVTAALFALETMYRSLQAVLMSLQAGAKELLNTARTSKVWKITAYPTPRTGRHPPDLASVHPYSDEPDNDETPSHKFQNGMRKNFPHQVYFSYFYDWVRENHKDLVDVAKMEWETSRHLEPSESLASSNCSNFEGFVVDGFPCSEPALWLLAAVIMSLSTHILPESATFELIAEVFDHVERERKWNQKDCYSNGSLTPRLQADLGYWRSFAQTRGLHLKLGNDKYAVDSLSTKERDELFNLLVWLIGYPTLSSWCQTKTVVKIHSKAGEAVVQSLMIMGLQISWHSEHSIVSHSAQTSSDIGPADIQGVARPRDT